MFRELRKGHPYLFNEDLIHENLACGEGEDDNMMAYKWDILFTRLKYRKIAMQKGFKKPYHFKRKDFQWIRDEDQFRLMGKIVLYDEIGNEIESRDLEWLNILSPELWELCKYDKDLSKASKLRNHRIWKYLTGGLTLC